MPKAPKPYHINKKCNKWEEENHLKQMEKKINNAKPTIPLAARAPPNVPRKKFPKPGLQPSTANTPRAQTADTHNNYYGCPLGHQVQLDMAHLDDLISRRLMELLKQPIVQQSIQKDASVVQARQQQEQLRRLAEAARRVTKPSSAPLPGQVKPPKPRGKKPEWNDNWVSPSDPPVQREVCYPLSRAASDNGRGRPISAPRGFSAMSSRGNSAEPRPHNHHHVNCYNNCGNISSTGSGDIAMGGGTFASGGCVHPGSGGGAFAGCARENEGDPGSRGAAWSRSPKAEARSPKLLPRSNSSGGGLGRHAAGMKAGSKEPKVTLLTITPDSQSSGGLPPRPQSSAKQLTSPSAGARYQGFSSPTNSDPPQQQASFAAVPPSPTQPRSSAAATATAAAAAANGSGSNSSSKQQQHTAAAPDAVATVSVAGLHARTAAPEEGGGSAQEEAVARSNTKQPLFSSAAAPHPSPAKQLSPFKNSPLKASLHQNQGSGGDGSGGGGGGRSSSSDGNGSTQGPPTPPLSTAAAAPLAVPRSPPAVCAGGENEDLGGKPRGGDVRASSLMALSRQDSPGRAHATSRPNARMQLLFGSKDGGGGVLVPSRTSSGDPQHYTASQHALLQQQQQQQQQGHSHSAVGLARRSEGGAEGMEVGGGRGSRAVDHSHSPAVCVYGVRAGDMQHGARVEDGRRKESAKDVGAGVDGDRGGRLLQQQREGVVEDDEDDGIEEDEGESSEEYELDFEDYFSEEDEGGGWQTGRGSIQGGVLSGLAAGTCRRPPSTIAASLGCSKAGAPQPHRHFSAGHLNHHQHAHPHAQHAPHPHPDHPHDHETAPPEGMPAPEFATLRASIADLHTLVQARISQLSTSRQHQQQRVKAGLSPHTEDANPEQPEDEGVPGLGAPPHARVGGGSQGQSMRDGSAAAAATAAGEEGRGSVVLGAPGSMGSSVHSTVLGQPPEKHTRRGAGTPEKKNSARSMQGGKLVQQRTSQVGGGPTRAGCPRESGSPCVSVEMGHDQGALGDESQELEHVAAGLKWHATMNSTLPLIGGGESGQGGEGGRSQTELLQGLRASDLEYLERMGGEGEGGLGGAAWQQDASEDFSVDLVTLEAGVPTGTGQWGARRFGDDVGQDEHSRAAHQQAQKEAIQRLKAQKQQEEQHQQQQQEQQQQERQQQEQQQQQQQQQEQQQEQQQQQQQQEQQQQQQQQELEGQQGDEEDDEQLRERLKNTWAGLEDSCVLMGTVSTKVDGNTLGGAGSEEEEEEDVTSKQQGGRLGHESYGQGVQQRGDMGHENNGQEGVQQGEGMGREDHGKDVVQQGKGKGSECQLEQTHCTHELGMPQSHPLRHQQQQHMPQQQHSSPCQGPRTSLGGSVVGLAHSEDRDGGGYRGDATPGPSLHLGEGHDWGDGDEWKVSGGAAVPRGAAGKQSGGHAVLREAGEKAPDRKGHDARSPEIRSPSQIAVSERSPPQRSPSQVVISEGCKGGPADAEQQQQQQHAQLPGMMRQDKLPHQQRQKQHEAASHTSLHRAMRQSLKQTLRQQPLRVSTSRPSMTEQQSAALAQQSAALFASLKQLHELMSGPRGKELSPKSTGARQGGGFTPSMLSPKTPAPTPFASHRPSAAGNMEQGNAEALSQGAEDKLHHIKRGEEAPEGLALQQGGKRQGRKGQGGQAERIAEAEGEGEDGLEGAGGADGGKLLTPREEFAPGDVRWMASLMKTLSHSFAMDHGLS